MNKNRILAYFLLLMSGITYYETIRFPKLSNDLQVVNAGFVPKLLALFLVICASILIIQSFTTNTEKISFSLKSKGAFSIALVLFLMVLYRYLLNFIGFEISTIFLLSAFMYIFELKDWRKMLGVSTVTMLMIYYIFILILNVPLPLRFL